MKKKFKCLCGHEEADHSWDPWSAFFGMCEWYRIEGLYDSEGKGAEEMRCDCDQYKPDTLRYVEEVYATKNSNGHDTNKATR